MDCEKCECYKWPGIHKEKQAVWVCANCSDVTLRIVERNKPMDTKEMIEKVEGKIKEAQKSVKELSVAQTICRWQGGGEDDGLTDLMISRLNGKASGLRFTLGLLKGKE